MLRVICVTSATPVCQFFQPMSPPFAFALKFETSMKITLSESLFIIFVSVSVFLRCTPGDSRHPPDIKPDCCDSYSYYRSHDLPA